MKKYLSNRCLSALLLLTVGLGLSMGSACAADADADAGDGDSTSELYTTVNAIANEDEKEIDNNVNSMLRAITRQVVRYEQPQRTAILQCAAKIHHISAKSKIASCSVMQQVAVSRQSLDQDSNEEKALQTRLEAIFTTWAAELKHFLASQKETLNITKIPNDQADKELNRTEQNIIFLLKQDYHDLKKIGAEDDESFNEQFQALPASVKQQLTNLAKTSAAISAAINEEDNPFIPHMPNYIAASVFIITTIHAMLHMPQPTHLTIGAAGGARVKIRAGGAGAPEARTEAAAAPTARMKIRAGAPMAQKAVAADVRETVRTDESEDTPVAAPAPSGPRLKIRAGSAAAPEARTEAPVAPTSRMKIRAGAPMAQKAVAADVRETVRTDESEDTPVAAPAPSGPRLKIRAGSAAAPEARTEAPVAPTSRMKIRAGVPMAQEEDVAAPVSQKPEPNPLRAAGWRAPRSGGGGASASASSAPSETEDAVRRATIKLSAEEDAALDSTGWYEDDVLVENEGTIIQILSENKSPFAALWAPNYRLYERLKAARNRLMKAASGKELPPRDAESLATIHSRYAELAAGSVMGLEEDFLKKNQAAFVANANGFIQLIPRYLKYMIPAIKALNKALPSEPMHGGG